MKSEDLLTPDNLEILSQLEKTPDYQNYFKWFLAITQIPHPTFKCEQIANKVCEWLQKLNISYERDDSNNIVVRLPANNFPENSPCVAIQTHLDMVWVGEEVDGKIKVELIKNFKNSSGKIMDILKAPKSTLGADDGFGLALCLEIIENKDKYNHGPLEIIMTTDEEQGLIGIKTLPKKNDKNGKILPFNFKYLINCDCLNSDKIYVSCPGCEVFNIKLFPKYEIINNGLGINIKLENFQGGHSGQTIQNGQGNPIKWITHILNTFKLNKIDYQISYIKGGQAMNAIPTNCECSFIIDEKNKNLADSLINTVLSNLKEDFSTIEKNINCSINYNNISSNINVLTKNDSIQIINVLTIIRHGIIRMHPKFKDKVDSSMNLAQVNLTFNKKGNEEYEAELFINGLSRASTNTEFDKITNSMKAIFELCPIRSEFSTYLGSRPWPAKEKSELAELMRKIAKENYNLDLEPGLTQVTIECPVFLTLGYLDTDIVSICSSIPLAHCIGEYLDIKESIIYRDIILKTLGQLTK
jgi:dipeptidase D